MVLKGFAAVGFLWVARQITKVIVPRIPEGRIKRILLFHWTN